jgi:hypothetical protein
VRQHAIDILLARGVPAKDYLGEIKAIFEWVQQAVRYTKDPLDVELLHTPRRMIELRAGDCDDMTILLGSMLESIGHQVRLVLAGPDAARPDRFSHIYLEVQHQGRWIPLDPTMPHPMGWAPRTGIKRAQAAPARAAAAREASALAHDRAAALYDRLALGGYGDAGEHRRLADWHRRAAEADRS